MVSEMVKKASIPASRGRRSPLRSGGTALVSQAKAPYIHQMAASISTICASASPFGWCTNTAVSCVMVKTKTRSKKSSSVETRSSSSLTTLVPMAPPSPTSPSLIESILVTKSVISPESPVRARL